MVETTVVAIDNTDKNDIELEFSPFIQALTEESIQNDPIEPSASTVFVTTNEKNRNSTTATEAINNKLTSLIEEDRNINTIQSRRISTDVKTSTKNIRTQKNNSKMGRKSANNRRPSNMNSSIRFISYSSLLFALIVRVMFSLHAGIAFWRVTVIAKDSLMLPPMNMNINAPYLNLCGIGLLFLETFITLLYRGGKEYKWFCPCVFFYLLSIVPSLLMLEYDMFYRYVGKLDNKCKSLSSQSLSLMSFLNADRSRRDVSDVINITTTQMPMRTIADAHKNLLEDLFGDGEIIKENMVRAREIFEGQLSNFEQSGWVLGLHQVLLFFLVIGRWMLPRGGISREQLSQLLLVFIGTGADILEFVSETIEDDSPSACKLTLHWVIWCVWAWSLFQFTLVLTASAGRKVRSTAPSKNTCGSTCCHTCCAGYFSNPDVWGMVLTLILQDIPFMAARCYFVFELKMRSQMMIFFALKNLLVIFLQVYRLGVLWFG